MAGKSDQSIKQNQLTGPWKDFMDAVNNLAPLSKSILTAENNVMAVRELEAQVVKLNKKIDELEAQYEEELAAHERSIQRLSGTREVLLDDFQKKYARLSQELDEVKTEAQRRLSAQAATSANELQVFRTEHISLQDENTKLSQVAGSTKIALDRTIVELTGTSELLRQAKRHGADLEYQIGIVQYSIRDLSVKAKTLQNRIHALSRRYLYVDFANETSTDDIFEKLYPLMEELRLAIAVSNTVVSKDLRVAAVEAIIASTICRNIFRTPLCSISLDSMALTKASEWISREETPDRCAALYSIFAASMASKDIEEIVDVAAEKVLHLIKPLLQDRGENFNKELTALLLETTNFWKLLQCSTGSQVFACLTADEGSQISGEKPSHKSDHAGQPFDLFRPYLITFPKIIVRGKEHAFHPGCVIWDSSKLALDAGAEAAKQLKRVQARGQVQLRNQSQPYKQAS